MDDREALGEQLRALETAGRAFDGGDRAATAALAAPLRAIFLGAGGDSLLGRLGGRFVHLLSTATDNPKASPARYWPALVTWDLDAGSMVLVAAPKSDSTRRADRPVAFSYWWESEPVYQAEHHKVRRRDLVLHAAGDEAPAGIRALLDAPAWKATVRAPGTPERDALIYGAAAASLRQIAHEVMHSPELTKLAGEKR